MKLNRHVSRSALILSGAVLAVWPCLQPPLAIAQPTSGVVLWDTGAPAGSPTTLQDRSSWKAVPSDLLILEANPSKASSDPGYYGREYSFKGDAVVENQKVLAVFWSATGRMGLYSKSAGNKGGDPGSTNGGSPGKILELFPLGQTTGPVHFEILRNADDEVVLQVTYHDAPQLSASFGFGRSEIIEIEPSANLKNFTIVAPLEYAVVPSFIGDDLIYGAQEKAGNGSDPLSLPNENMLLGLLKGESTQFVMTWPKGGQQIRLALGEDSDGKRPIDSIHLESGGQSFYLAPMAATGIWHKE